MTGVALVSRRRAWKVPRRVEVLLGVVLVCVFAFGLSARADAGVGREEPTVLAVWGLADGDTDVAGGTVRVFAGRPAARGGASRSGRALAQTNGRRADRTYRSGVTLLAFRRLPREFVVEVRGGRAGGRRVPGGLRAAVSGYRSGDVIYVNPVTTMMAAYRAAVERGSLDRSDAGARRLAYRELQIPHWMSQADLSYRDRRFDGDSFLAAARRAGGVGALIRRLLHDERAGRRFTESRRRRSRQALAGTRARAAGGVDRLRLSAAQAPLGPVPEAILQGLAGVALRAMVTGAALGAGEVARRNQIEVPGWLLAIFGDFARRVRIRGGRRLYLECRGTGRPTVILVSGYGNGGDVWSLLDPGVSRPPVMAGVARYSRVCAYDRPNSILQPQRPGRSDPVPQPRTAADAVAELHALLRAARLRGPYVLVGHSLGGLFVRLYASTYPRQVGGLVLVDATYELLRELFPPEQWAALARSTLEPVPGLDPPFELFDQDASFDQMLRAGPARPLRPMLPLAVLSHGLPAVLPPDLPPGFPDAATLERASRAAQNELGRILPHARHVIARTSGHYIQNAQPDLVIDAVRRVLRMVRPAAVRCRGDADSCRARVSLAGGASNKKVVIRLSHSDLRLVSVRPNRRTLRDAYGLFGQRLRARGTKYAFRLNAVQSIRRGGYLTITFRSAAG